MSAERPSIYWLTADGAVLERETGVSIRGYFSARDLAAGTSRRYKMADLKPVTYDAAIALARVELGAPAPAHPQFSAGQIVRTRWGAIVTVLRQNGCEVLTSDGYYHPSHLWLVTAPSAAVGA